jgi:polysaccharide deacetylase family protein (PEP-CTERM system associated)
MTARSPGLHLREPPQSGIAPTRPAAAPSTDHLLSGDPVVNALSIDVEDYFQVTALSERVAPADWPQFSLRVEKNTDNILSLLAERQIQATFFVLGWVAERCPALIRRIADAGHEVGSHGYSHVRVSDQDAESFKTDVERTRLLLEDIAGVPVHGYRAASFSLSPDLSWAYEALQETGYLYSSSLHPIRHDLYGAPNAPRGAFHPAPEAKLIEIPVSTLDFWGRRMPCGGGGYFRLLPYAYSRWAIRRLNNSEHQPCVFYFHPWEIDPDQPRVKGLSARSRFRHYTNLAAMQPKLARLFNDFEWSRIDQVYDRVIGS